MMRPLDGMLVVSLEQAIAAPYCSRLLADLGARVIKVERPDGGDFARHYDTRAHGASSHFVWTNRSKESLALDLKSAGSLEALKRLIARADVFLQNLAPGAADRLGLSSNVLREPNKRLISCNISGYGPGGPMGNDKSYDLLIQAEAGFLSITGDGDMPAKAGISIADIAAGVAAQNAILAALLQRERSGKDFTGCHIEISMLEALAEWMGYPLNYATDGAKQPVRAGASHASIFPYGPFKTRDGEVLFGLQNDREWQQFCRHVLCDEALANDGEYLGNAARYENRDELTKAINMVFRALGSDEILERMEKANIATARVNSIAELWDHPQLAARQRWHDVGIGSGKVSQLKPLHGDSWQPRMDPVPELGSDTTLILRELGYSDDDIAEIKSEGK